MSIPNRFALLAIALLSVAAARADGIANPGGSSGGGTPGGSSGQIQYNNAGAFGGTPTGAGVLTALGVNVGSAGAFIVNGGAGGTPASLNLTNATGLPAATGIASGTLPAGVTINNANWSGTVLSAANGGTNCSAASITCFNNITGLTASGTTGTTSTNLVFSTSPTFITPVLGVASATSIAFAGGSAASTSVQIGSNAANGLYARNSGCIELVSGGTVVIDGCNGDIQFPPRIILGQTALGAIWAIIGATAANYVNSGTASTFSAAVHTSYGTKPTITTGSCSASAATGGASAGTFTAPTCAAGTIILSGMPTQTTGYACDAWDQTTVANTLKQTASTATSATFTATTTNADVVVYKCMGF